MRVWPKMQRQHFRKQREDRFEKLLSEHISHTKRVCGWIWVAAKWSQKQGFVDTAYLLMQQMTDYVEDST